MGKSRASAAKGGSALENTAWWALLLVPVLVPTAIGKVPFFGGEPFSYNMFVYPKLFALAVLVGVCVACWGTAMLRGTAQLRTVPLKWWLLAAAVLAGLSTLLSGSPALSFFGGRYQAVGFFTFLLTAAVYIMVCQLVYDAERVIAMSWALVAGACGVAAIGLLQAVGLDAIGLTGLDSGWLAERGSSLLGNSDFTGVYLVVPTVVALSLGFSERTKGRRYLGVGVGVVLLIALFNTLTRGAWIAVALGIALLAVAVVRGSMKPTKVHMTLGAVLLGVPLVVLALRPDRFIARLRGLGAGDAQTSGRLVLWRDALGAIADRPLFGSGPDAYRLAWYGARSEASLRLTGMVTLTEDPHNTALLLASTLGVPAALAAIGFVGSALVGSAKAAFAHDAPAQRLVYSGWWAGLLVLCMALLLSPNTLVAMVLVFLCMGVLSAARTKRTELPHTWQRGIGVLSVVFAALALTVGVLTMVSDSMLLQAQFSDNKVQLAQRAAAIAPWNGEAAEQAAAEDVDRALAALSANSPEAPALAAAAKVRVRGLVASNPNEYRGWATLSYLLGNAGPVLGETAMQDAIAAADEALRIYPKSSEAAYLKASAQYGAGDFAGAVSTLAPLWEIDPNYPDPGIAYVQALAQAGNVAEARSVLATLRDRFPKSAEVAALVASFEAQYGAK